MNSDELLLRWGFSQNPFKIYTAEKEHNIDRIFLEPPYFNHILSNPLSPSSSIAFGYRGEGKSTLCKMVEYKINADFEQQVLLIKYTDFSAWSEKDVPTISLDDHLEKLIGLILAEFIRKVENDITLLEKLGSRELSLLQWYILRFLPAYEYKQVEDNLIRLLDRLPESHKLKRVSKKGFRRVKSYLRRKRVEIEKVSDSESVVNQIVKALLVIFGPSIPESKKLKNETLLNLLGKLRDVVMSVGISSIIITVDKIDETHVYSRNPELAFQLISPLITSIPYLELDKVATMLFLPYRMKDLLGSSIRTDRILTRTITWTNDGLKSLLRKRLIAFSSEKIDSLQPYIEPRIWKDFENNLFFYSAQCPRNMIRLLDFIISDHCEIDPGSKLITAASMKSGIDHFYGLRTTEQDSEEYENRLIQADYKPIFYVSQLFSKSNITVRNKLAPPFSSVLGNDVYEASYDGYSAVGDTEDEAIDKLIDKLLDRGYEEE